MAAHKYDEETYKYLKLEMYNAEDVAVMGEHATREITEHEELPSPNIIAKSAMKKGFNTFEVTHITEKVKRYMV